MTEYKDLCAKVQKWAVDRRIIAHSTPLAQATKTLEEVAELFDAIVKQDRPAQKDAYGDIFVTLIIGATIANLDILDCLESAYAEIKDRKGHLTPQGIFVKEQS